MRIVLAMLCCDQAQAAAGPERYLESKPLDRELGRALVRAGHEVEVVTQFPVDAIVDDGALRLRFIAPGVGARAVGALARRLGRTAAYYEPALRAIDAITRAGADVVHFHCTVLHLNLALLARRVGSAALVVQHHGGGPARNPLTFALQRRGFARADRVLFTSAEHARPFIAAGLLDGAARVDTVLEVSTPMKPPPRDEARRRTGWVGNPIFVSPGRLHPDKDPFTVLRGFEIIARSWPGARLYLCYLTAELLPALRRYVGERPALAARVEFLGRVPHEEMAAILASADFLVQGSVREVAGYAVIEGMAAGAIPVVTRIEAFDVITEHGRHGVLFPVGDAEALAQGVLAIDLASLPARRKAVRAHFEAHLSFGAVARRLEEIYARILAERRA
ncbi:MAG TPA: glycosyltransferase family 4 protein [Polyangiaceae bacterium]|jgi:glycosyltransferase involved in cell wall biosynthesis|nr:glycosyltransferase family 4 protein [Polyangiaceae bacterium]